MTPGLRVTAIISAYNEEDVIGQVVDNLIREGVQVHFLDDGSTDRTGEIVEAFLGRGVLAIENLRTPAASGEFRWADVLARKEALAQTLDADWFIHHDADEFRESPWPGVSLAEGITRVDRNGYNAIDFALFDFRPTHDRFTPNQDVRLAFQHYEPPRWWNRLQIKAWKKSDQTVDLVTSGGHEVLFPGRRVYPLRFILRHYPIRGSAHGRRKVFSERLPRFVSVERELGWHRHYDEYRKGQAFIRDASTMSLFEPANARMEAATEDIHRLERAREDMAAQILRLVEQLDGLQEELARSTEERARLADDAAGLLHALEAMRMERDRVSHELAMVYASRTWRWSRLLRLAAARLLGS